MVTEWGELWRREWLSGGGFSTHAVVNLWVETNNQRMEEPPEATGDLA